MDHDLVGLVKELVRERVAVAERPVVVEPALDRGRAVELAHGDADAVRMGGRGRDQAAAEDLAVLRGPVEVVGVDRQSRRRTLRAAPARAGGRRRGIALPYSSVLWFVRRKGCDSP